MNSLEKDKWLKASEEEFKGLTKMGIHKMVDCPSDHKTIECRWTSVLKSDSWYKARLFVKGYTHIRKLGRVR